MLNSVPGFLECAWNVLGIFLECSWNVLGMFWECSGNVLEVAVKFNLILL
jgi:hypothetical protein